ncbi:MAG: hypothetical protein ABIK12_17015, partial [Pseudomonadota bacterium]
MTRLLGILPILFLSAFMTAGFASGFSIPLMRTTSLLLVIAFALLLKIMGKKTGVSPITWTLAAYLALGAIAFWLWPAGLGRVLSRFPLPLLYLMLLLTATAPQLLGFPPFTTFFAKRRTPEHVRATDIFKRINRNMSWTWAAIFAACLLTSLAPVIFPAIATSRSATLIFTTFVPMALNLGIGLPFTMKYPDHYQRKLGINPAGQPNQLTKEKAMSSGSDQATGSLSVDNCRDLLKIMPQGFNPQAAGDLQATLQFHVSGDDAFSAYLEIADGVCAHHEGEAL